MSVAGDPPPELTAEPAAEGDTDLDLDRVRHDARILLGSVRQSIVTLLDAVETGGGAPPDLRALAARSAELEKTLRLVIEIELRLDELFAKHTKVLAAHEIDFDAVRHDIGCRLARIRECCAEIEFPCDPD